MEMALITNFTDSGEHLEFRYNHVELY